MKKKKSKTTPCHLLQFVSAFHTTCPVIKYFNHARVRPGIRKTYTGRDNIWHRHEQFATQRSPADLRPCHNCWLFPKVGGDSSIGRVSDGEARRNTDMGSSPPDQRGIFLPESTSRADSLAVSVQPPCATASTSVRWLKIPSTGSHTIVWTHGKTAHTDRNG